MQGLQQTKASGRAPSPPARTWQNASDEMPEPTDDSPRRASSRREGPYPSFEAPWHPERPEEPGHAKPAPHQQERTASNAHLGRAPEGYHSDWVRLVAEEAARVLGVKLSRYMGHHGLLCYFAVAKGQEMPRSPYLEVTCDLHENEPVRLLTPTGEGPREIVALEYVHSPLEERSEEDGAAAGRAPGFRAPERGPSLADARLTVASIEAPDLLGRIT